MTDTALDISTTSGSTAPPVEITQNNSPQPTIANEKVFTQPEVNELVGRVKQEAVERYKRQEQAQNVLPHTNISEADYRRMAAEEAQRLRDEWVKDAERAAHEHDAQRIANEFFTKINTGKGKYQDFDSVVGDIDFRSIPHIVQLANMVDNTSDIMYELGKNPSKIAILQQLIAVNPQLAFKEMTKLSTALKDNESASKIRSPNEPLSQLKPSTTGTDNGAMTVADYRKKYRG